MTKTHLLILHVSNFMKHYNTWSLLSEQAAESIHHLINQDLQIFSNISIKELFDFIFV